MVNNLLPVRHTRGSDKDYGPFHTAMWRLDYLPHNIYVAAPMSQQTAAMRLALHLIDAGFCVTSRWLRKDFSDRPPANEWKKRYAYEELWGDQDIADLRQADTLVLLSEMESTSGGYHFELGYFLGLGRHNVVVVGERRNVFFYNEAIRFTPSLHGLVDWLLDSSHGTIALSASTEATSEDFQF